MRRLHTEEIDEDNLDLEPSAEDLEIFAELDREEVERQARIDRGEPPFDPMVRYNKIMDNYIKKVRRFEAKCFNFHRNCTIRKRWTLSTRRRIAYPRIWCRTRRSLPLIEMIMLLIASP